MTLSQARQRRDEARKQLAAGADPGEEKKAVKQAQRVDGLTFETLAREWYDYNSPRWADATAYKAKLYLDNDIIPGIGGRPIKAISRPELVELVRTVEARGTLNAAGKIRQWLKPAVEKVSPYRTWVANAVERPMCRDFETVGNKVAFWSAVCWEAVKSVGERSIVRPFSTEQKAQWAAQVLTTHYPGRVYALLRQISEKEVEKAQMEVFERSVMDDVLALELAAKYAIAPD